MKRLSEKGKIRNTKTAAKKYKRKLSFKLKKKANQ